MKVYKDKNSIKITFEELKNTEDNSFVFFCFKLSKDVPPRTIQIIADTTYNLDISSMGLYQIHLKKTDQIEIITDDTESLTNFSIKEISLNYSEQIKSYQTIFLKEVLQTYRYTHHEILDLLKEDEVLSSVLRNIFRSLLLDVKEKQDKDKIISLLDLVIHKFYNIYIDYPQNWWDFEIAIPKALIRMIVLLYNDLTLNQIYKYLNIMHRFSANPLYLHYNWKLRKRIDATGANLSDMIEITTWRHIFMGNLKGILSTFKAFSSLFKYTDKLDGFYKDGSFIQHDHIAYTGSYGEVLLVNISWLLKLFSSTGIDIKKVLLFLKEIIKTSFLPTIFDGQILDTLRGRSISRSHISNETSAHTILNSILRIIQYMDKDTQDEILDEVIRLKGDNFKQSDDLNFDLSKAVNHLDIVWAKAFQKMNQYIVKSNDAMIGLSLSGKDIYTHELMNGENKKGWYNHLGYTPIYIKGSRFYDVAYYPTVNPYYLAGVTNTNKPIDENTEGVFHPNKLTYGIQVGDFIWAHFDLKMPFNLLTAHKSYLLFKNGIVQTISNIVSEDPAHTTLINLPTKDTDLSNNKVSFKDLTLTIQSSHKIQYKNYHGTCSYKTFNDFESDKLYTTDYHIAYIEHQDKTDNYWYILNDINVSSPKIEQLSKNVHVISHEGYTFINLFDSGLYQLDMTIQGIGAYILYAIDGVKHLRFVAKNRACFKHIKILTTTKDYIVKDGDIIIESNEDIIDITYEVLT